MTDAEGGFASLCEECARNADRFCGTFPSNMYSTGKNIFCAFFFDKVGLFFLPVHLSFRLLLEGTRFAVRFAVFFRRVPISISMAGC